MSVDSFIAFVNNELPLRAAVTDEPGSVVAGTIPVATGIGFNIHFVDPDTLAVDGKSAYDIAVENGFEGTEEQWIESLKGENGDSAYEVAVDQGFVGTEQEWLDSLKGDKGDKGDQGTGLKVIGELMSPAQLPDPANYEEGDAFYINKHAWVVVYGQWIDCGDISGPAGRDGIGLRILGTFPSVEFLPMEDNESGDSYIIQYQMWVWDTQTWSPVGQVGPAGMSAYQLAVQQGFQGSLNQWLASLNGKSAYQVAVDQGFVGSTNQWLASLKGDQGIQGERGEQGEIGPSAAVVRLMGSRDTTDDLPTDAETSDGYLVGQDLYVWTGDVWVNVGQIRGPEGQRGIQGERGIPGPDGMNAYEVAVVFGFEGTEQQWLDSLVGDRGMSAYEVAVANGFTGDETEWLASLKGDDGEQGLRGFTGAPGAGLRVVGRVDVVDDLPVVGDVEEYDSYVVGERLYTAIDGVWEDMGRIIGEQGERGETGETGETGQSAYQLAVQLGFEGNESQWIISLKGEKGDIGDTGPDGKNAYQVAVDEGFEGTVSDWLESIKGDKGDKGDQGDQGIQGNPGADGTDGEDGASAYEVAVENGFVGTEQEWLASIQGKDGRSVIIQGVLASVNDLPVSGELGDAFLIATNIWGWTGEEWENFGPFQGPRGIQGPRGLTGEKGDKGDQGIQGEMGPALNILGSFDNPSELPSVGEVGDGYLINGHFWGWTGSAFEDLGTVQGPQGLQGQQGERGVEGPEGKSAYQVAVDNGFEGTETEWLDTVVHGADGESAYQLAVENGFVGSVTDWLASLKGDKGDVGDQGEQGIQGNPGADGTDGEDGASAYEVAVINGFVGSESEWLESLNGLDGRNFTIHGVLDSSDELPSTGELGESYLVAGSIWGWTGSAFEDFGPLRGPQGIQGVQGERGWEGKTAYEVAIDNGFVGTEQQWLESLHGPQGEKGDRGEMGPALTIIGNVASPSELPPTGELGQGYLIDSHFWGWTGEQWEDLGTVQGPEGPQGPKGDPGTIGDQGTLWIILGRNPEPTDGRYQDLFLNSSTLQYYRKVSQVLWAPLGYLGGGNVYDAPQDDQQYVRINGDWAVLQAEVEEAPIDGRQFVRKDAEWVEMEVAVGEAPQDNKQYVRKDAAWTELTAEVENPPAREGSDPVIEYARTNDGTWEPLNRADGTIIVHGSTDSKSIMTPQAVQQWLANDLHITWSEELQCYVSEAPSVAQLLTALGQN